MNKKKILRKKKISFLILTRFGYKAINSTRYQRFFGGC